MTVSRRDFFVGGSLLTALAAANSVSACSPADPFPTLEIPGEFFSLITKMELIEARKLVSAEATLVLATSLGIQTYSGPEDIAEAAHQLIGVEGFTMIGDTDEVNVGGMYWRRLGPWACSDMLKGGAVEINGCGDALHTDVFNVFVHLEGELLRSIMIMENRNLTLDWGDGLGLAQSRGIRK